VRILLVGNHWTRGPGGAETMMVLTTDLLCAAGHEVVPFAVAEDGTLPTPVRDRLPAPAGDGARTRFGEAWAGTWSPRAYRSLARVVEEVQPDVAHVHHVFERLTPAVLDALRHAGVPTVMTLHDYKPVCPNYRLFTDGAPCTRCLSGRYVEVVRHRCLEGSRWRSVAAAVEAYAARIRGLYRRVDRFLAPSAFLRDRVIEGGAAPTGSTCCPIRSSPRRSHKRRGSSRRRSSTPPAWSPRRASTRSWTPPRSCPPGCGCE
jgi:glycosyltransferase involved in cell wall biosynthesis